MRIKLSLLAGAAALALSLTATAASAGVSFFPGPSINPATAPDVAPPVTDLNNAVIVKFGHDNAYDGWDPYGDTEGGYATTDETHAWLSIAPGGSATESGLNGSLSLIWGSPNYGNEVDFYDGAVNSSDLVGTVVTSDLPGWYRNTGAPGYSVMFTGNFTAAVFSETAGGDFEIGFTNAVPEASTWAMMGLGLLGLAYAGYGARRTPVAVEL